MGRSILVGTISGLLVNAIMAGLAWLARPDLPADLARGYVRFLELPWFVRIPYVLILIVAFFGLIAAYETWREGHNPENRSGWGDAAIMGAGYVVMGAGLFVPLLLLS